MFRFAADEDEIIATNPASRIRIPLDAPRGKKIVPPTREQVATLIEHAVDQDTRDAITVASATGLRRGELFGAKWGDLDFERRLIHVQAFQLGGRERRDEERGRRAGRADVRVRPQGARRPEAADTVRQAGRLRVCHQGRGPRTTRAAGFTATGSGLNPSDAIRSLDTLDAAKLKGVRWHDLRHYAVSALIAERADVKLLQAIAGHASATMTLDVYGHLMTERVEEAASMYDPLREAIHA